jgi:hypothetical protein
VGALRETIIRVLRQYQPMTVHQVFYRFVSMGIIDKIESEYKATVCQLLSEMRREHRIPSHSLADNTRWQREPRSYSSLDHLLRETATLYRLAAWEAQDAYVEIWLEKDALSDVLEEQERQTLSSIADQVASWGRTS